MEQQPEVGSLRQRVLELVEIQMEGAAELLAFYIERFEPWPADDEESLTEIHERWVRVQRGYEEISRAVERTLAGNAAQPAEKPAGK